jgi:AraC-like DNA-binding protein
MARKRNGPETLDLRRRCWELRAQGWTLERIAREVGLTTTTVGEHIQRTQAEARKVFAEEIAGQQALRLAQLDSVLQEALDAWQASRSEETSTVTEGRVAVLPPGGEGQDPVVPLPDLVVRHTRKGGGDPALLGRVLEAIEDIRQLLGLDAPKRVQVEPPQEPIKLYAGIDFDKV